MALHNERCKDCKQRVLEFLEALYGDVATNYDLDLPCKLDDYKIYFSIFDSLTLIHNKLKEYRGFSGFVRANKLPRVDYYVPAFKFVVEFDESQHFTKPRGITLMNYPENLALGFLKSKWIDLSLKLNKRDNDPPYRDEQRAWYDTLRDFSALLLNNLPTVRLFSKDISWCSLNVKKQEDIDKFSKFINHSFKNP